MDIDSVVIFKREKEDEKRHIKSRSRHDTAQADITRHDPTQHDTIQHSKTQQNTAKHSEAQQNTTQPNNMCTRKKQQHNIHCMAQDSAGSAVAIYHSGLFH